MTYVYFRYACVALVAFGLAWLAYSIARRPTQPASRLGMRGLKRQRALLHNVLWAEVEPLVRWLGVRASAWHGSRSRSKLDQRLTYAGDFLGLTPDEYAALVLLGALCGAALGGALSFAFGRYTGHWPVPAGIVAGVAWPVMRLDRERESRMKSIHRGLPYAIDLMALSMSAGLDFPGSVMGIVEKSRSPSDHLLDELRFLLQQLELGSTRREALLMLQSRAPSEAVRELVQAFIQAEEHGNPVATVLQIQASVARVKRTHAAQQAAQSMNSKMVLPIFMMVGVTMVLILLPTQKLIEQMIESLR